MPDWFRDGIEYSETGNDRSAGSVTLLGGRALRISLKRPDASRKQETAGRLFL